MTLRTAFLWTLIISLAGAALLGIMVIIFPDFVPADEEILITSLLLGVYSIAPLGCSIVLGRGRVKWAMWTGIIAGPLAWLLWMPMIWGSPWNWPGDPEEVIIKSALTATMIAGWATHLGLLMLLRLDRSLFRFARNATLGIGALLTALGIAAMWFEWDEEWLFRTIAVLLILVSAGTIITPIFALLDLLRRRSEHESVPNDLCVHLTCPRCRHEQDLQVGISHCARCNLRIELNVEEPRCACGYLLYQLIGDCCPECGRRLQGADLWRPASKGPAMDSDMRQNMEPDPS